MKIEDFKNYIAKCDDGKKEFGSLYDHTMAVYRLYVEFTKKFGNKNYLPAIIHDYGKTKEAFQYYITHSNKEYLNKFKNEERYHSEYGAVSAANDFKAPEAWSIVMSHHSALLDTSDMIDKIKKSEENPEKLELTEDEIERFGVNCKRNLSMFDIRVLFGALIDADWMASWEYSNKEVYKVCNLVQRYERTSGNNNNEHETTLCDFFIESLSNYMKRFDINNNSVASDLIKRRKKIFSDCITAADSEKKVFSLTVPTGGGKTLSSLGFGLHHCKKHNLERIIFVIPYLSIIEQNAKVYKEIINDRFIFEHHSAVTSEGETKNSDKKYSPMKHYENWNVPIVITTSVQFLESLFTNNNATRKLHNLTNSLIIFDEAQTIPIGMSKAIFGIFDELVDKYNTHFVFSTASQPSIEMKNKPVEIIGEVESLFKEMNRVQYKYIGEKNFYSISNIILEKKRAMCVLNTKKDAEDLYEIVVENYNKLYEKKKIPKTNIFIMTTNLCAKNRMDIIKRINSLLKRKRRCILISTQLIEAGVDIDFDFGLRALGPLDSILQAGGRVNRNGKHYVGEFVVFDLEHFNFPDGAYRIGRDVARSMINENIKNCNGNYLFGEKKLISHSDIKNYFERLKNRANSDVVNLIDMMKNGEFKKLSDSTTIIDKYKNCSVVVYYKNKKMIDELMKTNNDPNSEHKKHVLGKRIQHYIVNYSTKEFQRLVESKKVVKISETLGVEII